MSTALRVVTSLSPENLEHIHSVINAAAEVDDTHPFSEEVLLSLRIAQGAQHVLAYESDELAGYAFVDLRETPTKVELVVAPQFRRHGVGRTLLDAVAAEHTNLQLWAHGSNAAAAQLATSMNFHHARTVLQLRRSLLTAISEVQPIADVELRTFNPATDIDAWLECNRAAFANHPEQGSWTGTDLEMRMRQPWFDCEGFIVACHENRMVGFHWTKVHAIESHEPLGEVYVLGIRPEWQGRGLGKMLTIAGLKHLREIGLTAAMLYVDQTNLAARDLYASLGFVQWDSDTLFVKNS